MFLVIYAWGYGLIESEISNSTVSTVFHEPLMSTGWRKNKEDPGNQKVNAIQTSTHSPEWVSQEPSVGFAGFPSALCDIPLYHVLLLAPAGTGVCEQMFLQRKGHLGRQAFRVVKERVESSFCCRIAWPCALSSQRPASA